MRRAVLVLAFILTIVLASAASAQPIPPEQFYGYVYIQGNKTVKAPDGLTVAAVINGTVVDTANTTGGKYGYAPDVLKVPGKEGDVIQFVVIDFNGRMVNTNKTAVFESGAFTMLNLSVRDNTPPAVKVKIEPHVVKPGEEVKIYVRASDNLAGIESVKARIYNKTYETVIPIFNGEGSWIARGRGSYLVDIIAEDRAGNVRVKTAGVIGVGYEAVGTHTAKINATAGKKSVVNTSDMSIELETNTNVSGMINVVEYEKNPEKGINGLRDIGKFIDIIPAIPNKDVKDVIIKVYYSDKDVKGIDESTLRLYTWSDEKGKWVELEGGVNTKQNYVWGKTTHFSLYAVFGKPVSAVTSAPVYTGGGGGGGYVAPTSTSTPTQAPTATPTATQTPAPKKTPTPTPTPETTSTSVAIPSRTTMPTTTPSPTPTPKPWWRIPGFESALAVVAMIAAAVILRRR